MFIVAALHRGKPHKKGPKSVTSMTLSTISSERMWNILDKLKSNKNRRSTNANYLQIWWSFNKFLIRLDRKSEKWEQRVALYCAFLVDKGNKSTTIRSYVSAIKNVLRVDGYNWNDNLIILDTIIKSCKLINDRVCCRLPIQKGLLELLLFEIERIFQNHLYLECMYKAIFAMSYYGLMRVGELAAKVDNAGNKSNHAVKACDIHVGQNKEKIMIILRSSKTHGKESLPQKIKISADSWTAKRQLMNHFSPFELLRTYMKICGNYDYDVEQFFVFKYNVKVQPEHIRNVLKLRLRRLGLNEDLYNRQSFRIGRATDLIVKANWPVELVKRMGRWKSNAVYKYVKI